MTKRIRIEQRKNLTIISGPPGSGKTTALQQMADQARNNGRKVTSILWPSTLNGIRRIIADDLPSYVTIDSGDHDDGLLVAVTHLAQQFHNIHFIITTAE